MHRIKKFLVGLLILIAASYIGICFALSNRVLDPQSSMDRTLEEIPRYWNTTFEEMMTALPEPEEVTIPGFEGIPLHGQYFSISDTAECLFILAHGWGRNWPNMLKYIPVIDTCGCDMLLYDHRAHGLSGGSYPTGGIKESKDLIAVTSWASKKKGYQWDQMAWLGSSWGAATALLAGADTQNPAFIVADSPFQDWYSAIFERAIKDYGPGIKAIAPGVMQVVNWRSGTNYREASPVRKAVQIEEPVLLLHSEADPETAATQSGNIASQLNERSEFHLTQWGNAHVMDAVNNPVELRELLISFLRERKLEHFLPKTNRPLNIDSVGH